MLVATRVICQGGIAYFTLTAAPMDGLMALFGPKAFTHVGLVVAAVIQKMLFVDLRESLMPSLLHARKLSDGTSSNRRIFVAIIITLALGILVSFAAMLTLCYKFGVRELQFDWASRTTLAVYDNLFTLIETPVEPGRWVMTFILVGAVLMLVPGDLLSPFLLVAHTSHRLFDSLQFRHVVFGGSVSLSAGSAMPFACATAVSCFTKKCAIFSSGSLSGIS